MQSLLDINSKFIWNFNISMIWEIFTWMLICVYCEIPGPPLLLFDFAASPQSRKCPSFDFVQPWGNFLCNNSKWGLTCSFVSFYWYNIFTNVIWYLYHIERFNVTKQTWNMELMKYVGKLFSTATCDHLIIYEWPGGFKNFSALAEQQY